jgi:hypothetical protein
MIYGAIALPSVRVILRALQVRESGISAIPPKRQRKDGFPPGRALLG